jgi:hypothetical protein
MPSTCIASCCSLVSLPFPRVPPEILSIHFQYNLRVCNNPPVSCLLRSLALSRSDFFLIRTNSLAWLLSDFTLLPSYIHILISRLLTPNCFFSPGCLRRPDQALLPPPAPVRVRVRVSSPRFSVCAAAVNSNPSAARHIWSWFDFALCSLSKGPIWLSQAGSEPLSR